MIEVTDPAQRIWKPISAEQEEYIQLPDSIFEGFFGGCVKCGKALALDTLVPTLNGMKSLRSLDIGDFVYGPDGNPVKVIGVSEIFHNHECFKLTFDSGIQVVADADHLWKVGEVGRNNNSPQRILRTRELFTRSTINQRYRINCSQPLTGSHVNVPIPPYTLGAWLGDGNSVQGQITNDHKDNEILRFIELEGFNVTLHNFSPYNSYGILRLKEKLFDCSLLGNKRIPSEYFDAHLSVRLELLKGLLDTDGSIDKRGRIELTLSNEKLALDALRLIRTLGIKPTININDSTLNGKVVGKRWRIFFFSEIQVFKLYRKWILLEHWITNQKKRKSISHYIDKIESTVSVPTKCIKVEGDYFLITEACIPTHNTELGLVLPLIKGFYKERRFKGLILRRTFPELESEVIHRARDFYPQTGAVWKPEIKAYEWPEYNSRVRFGHAQHEKDIHNYDTDEYQYFNPDELTALTEWMYLYIAASRVRRTPANNISPIVRPGSMPGNIGHGWVRKRWIEPAREGGKIIKDKDGNKRIFVKAKPIRDLDPEYYDRLKLLPRAEYLAKMGDWWTFSGQVFEDWRIEHLENEPGEACHVVKPFEIPKWWPRLFAMDVGHQTYMLWGAVSPDERLYIYREKWFDKAQVYEYGNYAKEVSVNDGRMLDAVLDWTAFDTSHGETTASLFRKYSGYVVRPADKGAGSRVSGKVLMQDIMRWRAYDEQTKAIKYVAPRLQVFDTCTHLIDTIPLCVYDKKDGVELDDIAEFNGDEPIDTVRYLAKAYINFARSAKTQFEEFQRTALIVRQLERTGDMTEYYRRMEIAEHKKRYSSVRRSSFIRNMRRRSA